MAVFIPIPILRSLALAAILGFVVLGSGVQPARADDAPTFTIVIKDHVFDPSEVTVPVGKRVKLIVENRDSAPEEFESLDLRREKVIAGGATATIWVGPLPAGEYVFVGEFHEDTAHGKLIAK